MNKNTGIIIGVIALAVIVGGIYVSVNNKNDAMMAKEKMDQKVMEDQKMTDEKTAMMQKEDSTMGAGVILKDGKIMLEVGKVMTPLIKDYIFETGVKVSLTGLVTKKDGTTLQLKAGESAWGDGSVMKASEGMMGTETTKTDSMMKKEDAMMKAGTYEAYSPEKIAMASGTHRVVLFFRASWCPTCVSVDKDIKNNLGKIPGNLTILDVNYDNSSVLKQKYGVTYQHTFVQVDKDGNLIKKWSASPTLNAIVSEIK